MRTSKLRIETLTSPPITIQGAEFSLRSRLVQLSFPAINGGLIWNRPVGIVVRNPDEQEKIVPILDITRIAIFAWVGLCFTCIFVLFFLRRKKSTS